MELPPCFVLQYTTERIPHALKDYKGVFSYQLSVLCLKVLHVISSTEEGSCQETLESQRNGEDCLSVTSLLYATCLCYFVHFCFYHVLKQVFLSLAGNIARFKRLRRGSNDIGLEFLCYDLERYYIVLCFSYRLSS